MNCGCYKCSSNLDTKDCFVSVDGKYLCKKCCVGVEPASNYSIGKIEIYKAVSKEFKNLENKTTWLENLHRDKFIENENSLFYDFYYDNKHYSCEYFYNTKKIEHSYYPIDDLFI